MFIFSFICWKFLPGRMEMHFLSTNLLSNFLGVFIVDDLSEGFFLINYSCILCPVAYFGQAILSASSNSWIGVDLISMYCKLSYQDL